MVSSQTQAPMLSGGSLLPSFFSLSLSPPLMSSVAYNCPRLLRQSNLVLSVLGGSRIPWTSRDPPLVSPQTGPHPVRRIPWTSRDPPLVSPHTQTPMLSGGSLGHPRILPWCPLTHRPPCCPEDPLDIPGSSLGVPSDTGRHEYFMVEIFWGICYYKNFTTSLNFNT